MEIFLYLVQFFILVKQAVFIRGLYQLNITISERTISWNDAVTDGQCEILGKGISSNVKLDTVRVSPLFDPGRSGFWIGATQSYSSWITIKNCYPLNDSDIKSKGKTMVSENPLKECFEFCNSEFSIFMDECNCNPSNKTTNRRRRSIITSECSTNETCIIFNNTVCVFQPLSLPSDSRKGNCKTASWNRGSYTLRTDMCNSFFPFIGDMGYGLIRDLPGNQSFLLVRFRMIIAGKSALDSGTFPYSNLSSHWVGIFRYQTFQWHNDNQFPEEYECIAVRYHPDGSLSPFIRPCDSKLPFACVVNKISADPTSKESEKCDSNSVDYTGIIVGGVLEGIIAILLAIFIVLGVLRHLRDKRNSSPNQVYNTLDLNDRSPPALYDTVGNQDRVYAEARQTSDPNEQGDYVNTR